MLRRLRILMVALSVSLNWATEAFAQTRDSYDLSQSLINAETPGFAERGGIIRFTVEDNRVRFEINVEAAHLAELTISSRLLTLARIIQQPAVEVRKPG